MKYLSVCSGIEAATVAWHSLGWTPLAFSEIEAFPRAVLQHHYPNVPIYGDFTKLRDEPIIEDADILVGGTPCQAFSVAGLRKSLGDDRGNLTLEFVRLADAIDNARLDRGKPASIIVWENVPGVLSVKDNAFGCFLSGLAGDNTPYVPPRGKWTNAGVVAGPKRTVAWRVLDAQYFGLAQRRRRVFVVASAGDGFDPAAVLFECEGVRRDTPPRREAGKVAPTIPSRSTAGGGLRTDFDCDGGVIRAVAMEDPVPPLMARSSRGGAQTLSPGHQTDGHMVAVAVDEVAETLIATDHKGPGHNRDHNFVTHSLRAEGFDASEDGTGRGTPLVPVAFSAKDHGADATADLSPTLRAMPHHSSHANDGGQMAVAFAQNTRDEVRLQGGDGQIVGALAAEPGMKQTTYVAIPIDTMNALRGDQGPRTGIGIGEQGDPSFTITKGHSHAVAYAFQPRIARNGRGDMGEVVNAINAQSGKTGKGDAAPCVAIGIDSEHNARAELMGPLQARAGTNNLRASCSVGMAVRRLTPVECSRLQGFPDDYLLSVTWRGKCPPPDGPMYKALGNSMAVPVMRWIGQRIYAETVGEANG